MVLKYFACFLFICAAISTSAQTFRAGVMGGLNLSQVDGDGKIGFNKPGVQLGVKAVVVIKETFDVNIELLLNQKGAAFPINPAVPNNRYVIGLNYMEVPVLMDFHFGRVTKDHYKHHLAVGFGYARLVGSDFKEGDASFTFKKFEPEFKKNELSPVFGYSYYFSKRIGIDFRYSFALTDFYTRVGDVPSSDRTRTEFLRNFYLTARASYVF